MLTIVTDSTSDLGADLLQKYQIQMIPLYVQHLGKTFRDGIDIDNSMLFGMVDRTHELPKTSAASIGDFMQIFTEASECICLTISSSLSATYQNAVVAQEQIGRNGIRVVDSLNLSSGIGLLALRAADMRDRGCPVDEIDRAITALRSKVHTSFVLETLEYVYMGGRCTAIQNFASSILKIRPILEVSPDGSLGVKDKIRGSRKKALDSLLEDLRQKLPVLDRQRVFITHTDCPEDAEYLRGEVQKLAAPDEILITVAGSVISSHCGPKTIGILYLTK
jgi:DegV family protein with EDD domain